ncbi:hypothetical protein BTR23_01560 [Alkalihalophilus pseudofirmus]|nr:hypothetical protein BTR23_01560 [Alkalihalophilus pseudofirmus]
MSYYFSFILKPLAVITQLQYFEKSKKGKWGKRKILTGGSISFSFIFVCKKELMTEDVNWKYSLFKRRRAKSARLLHIFL